MESKGSLRLWASRQRSRRSAVLLDEVLADVIGRSSRIAAYVAVGDEPRVTVQPGWLLPVVTPDLDLDWAVYDGGLATRRGVQEPPGPLLGPEAISRCDLVLVPALLVDRHGHRLGKGGGCYDRALPRTNGLTVALVHDDELLDELPVELHDVRVEAVATPFGGLVRLRGKM